MAEQLTRTRVLAAACACPVALVLGFLVARPGSEPVTPGTNATVIHGMSGIAATGGSALGDAPSLPALGRAPVRVRPAHKRSAEAARPRPTGVVQVGPAQAAPAPAAPAAPPVVAPVAQSSPPPAVSAPAPPPAEAPAPAPHESAPLEFDDSG
jgi:hypothetical protein